jgi:hypothetical protein
MRWHEVGVASRTSRAGRKGVKTSEQSQPAVFFVSAMAQ